MKIKSIDHLVLVVKDPEATCAFYNKVLGMKPEKDSQGRWFLKFDQGKLSLHAEGNVPEIARQTVRGSANFCLLTDTPIQEIIRQLKNCGIKIAAGPGRREGANYPLMSVYFYDIDGNLVEVSNPLPESESEEQSSTGQLNPSKTTGLFAGQ